MPQLPRQPPQPPPPTGNSWSNAFSSASTICGGTSPRPSASISWTDLYQNLAHAREGGRVRACGCVRVDACVWMRACGCVRVRAGGSRPCRTPPSARNVPMLPAAPCVRSCVVTRPRKLTRTPSAPPCCRGGSRRRARPCAARARDEGGGEGGRCQETWRRRGAAAGGVGSRLAAVCAGAALGRLLPSSCGRALSVQSRPRSIDPPGVEDGGRATAAASAAAAAPPINAPSAPPQTVHHASPHKART
jgi:hypothetical protein